MAAGSEPGSVWDLTSGVNESSMQGVFGGFFPFLMLIMFGVAIVWTISFFAEGALQKLKPVAVFLMICFLIGFAALGSFNGSG